MDLVALSSSESSVAMPVAKRIASRGKFTTVKPAAGVDGTKRARSKQKVAPAKATRVAVEKPARKIAENAGNTIVTLDEAEVARWQQAAMPVVDRWVAEMDKKGIDGKALIEEAQGLIKKYESQ